MTNIVILNSQTHRNLRVRGGASAALGDNQRFVQVVVKEFPLLAVHYPILFSKDAETGRFYCGAMLGFDEGENLFLGDDAAQSTYRPLNLQRAPFYVSGTEIGIDLDSPRISESDGEALFTERGEPTSYLESITSAFREIKSGIEMTRLFIEKLMSLKLIEPIEIDLAFDDGTRRNVIGLYSVNQETLRELPDTEVLELFRRGYLHLIYLMIASMKQVPVLAQKKNRRMRPAEGALSMPR